MFLPVVTNTIKQIIGSYTSLPSKGISAFCLLLFLFLSVSSSFGQTTVTSQVSNDNDDAEERVSNGDMDRGSSDLELIRDGSNDQLVGIRFRNINVPQGATIISANIQFTTDETDSQSTSLVIRGQDENNPGNFGNGDYNISSRTLTSASVAWNNIPAWNTVGQAGPNQQTPNLSAIVQEIVDRGGWSSGNSMVFVITGSGQRTAESHDGSSSGAPVLTIEYSTAPVITIDDITVNEGDGTATFTATHTGANTVGVFTVDYTTVNGTASSGSDYTATTGTLIFTGTSGVTRSMVVNILDDTEVENLENFSIQFTARSNPSVIITDTGTASIVDNDTKIITNGVTDYSCSGALFDSGGTGNYSNNENLIYTLCPDTANTDIKLDFNSFDVESGYDFLYVYDGTTTSATLIGQYHNGNPPPSTITATNASGCLTFRFTSDYSVTGAGWEASISCQPRGPRMNIEDIMVNEGAGTAIFTVTHNGPNATGPFTVNYQTVNGTASSGSDYTSTTGTLSFNGTSGDTESFTVAINDDGIIESNETFTIQLTSSSDGSVNLADTAIATIVDDDGIIMTNGTTVNTCSDTFLDPGGINDYSNNQDIVYTICPDTADNYISLDFIGFDVANGDLLYIYEGTTTSGTLIGQYNNNNVPDIIESTHSSGCLTFRFISNGSNTAGGWEAEVNCYPEGPKIVIDDISFDEDIGNAVFTVRQTRARHGYSWLFGFVHVPYTVNFETVDGSALAGSDYTATSGTLTFNGQLGNVQTISVPISNDGVPENAEEFTIRFTGATASYGTINYSDTGTGTINTQILANDPLTLFQEFDGYYDYSTTGGTLRTQSNSGNACAITSSSSNTLVSPIPASATVERAYLYWAHSNTVRDPDVTFEGQNVSANYLYQTTLTNRNFYGYVSDVTSIVQGIANPSTNTYDFSDLDIDNTGNYCSTATVLGGWTLIVFYEDPSLPAVNINLYQGFDGLSNSGTSFTLDSFFAIAGSGAKASFLSWEGDPNLDGSSSGSSNPEELSITNQSGTTYVLTGDGGQPGNNAYNSTIYDNTVSPVYNTANSYGVDLDTYDISTYIQPSDTQVTANVDVGQDFVISAAVVIKVPSNLIAGRVFEDVNYPGGPGRDRISSGGLAVSGAVVELFDSAGNFVQRKTTDINGYYSFGGMADGDYRIKAVNSTVRSNRGGLNCSTCYPIQTFRKYRGPSSLIDVTDEVGGANPAAQQDVALGVINNAQSVSTVSVSGDGVVGIDFGFNFNTIVNTNEFGQGSLEQFIVNSNNLNETGLDIEANSIFDPAAGEDTSIFMIPPTSDALGRTADANFASGYFDINITDAYQLSVITGTNTIIDGRTQTAYSGDSNSGTIGDGGTTVGIAAAVLPDYNLPEIQVRGDSMELFRLEGNSATLRNLAIYTDDKSAIQVNSGTAFLYENLLGVNALGAKSGNLEYAVEIKDGATTIARNYLSGSNVAAVHLDGGTSTVMEYNHFYSNGANDTCSDNILIEGGSGITIRYNLINEAAGIGIEGDDYAAGLMITENTITNNGVNNNACGGGVFDDSGIRLKAADATVYRNVIHGNHGEGIVVAEDVSGILISQNSIYNNGQRSPSLGIDLDASKENGDGVTLNDSGDGDNGPNNLLNFPIIEAAYATGTNLIVEGWARPGAIIELFLTDINEGSATAGDNQLGMTTDYGEGQIYLATVVEGSGSDTRSGTSSYTDLDGNTDNTNRFKVSIPLPPGVEKGDFITATATISNSTSEFSPQSIIKGYTVITNRRITYRVKKN
ncbi:Calx-beta domain-containing protein [Arenibacter palladensis]|nr:Calx-beta domain-containing protein [Arenibacter palladensis]